ncbi:MAG: ABC transporter substrate-binding protein [Halorhabdus sp.]
MVSKNDCPPLSRRKLLGGVSAGLAAGSAGCLEHARSLINRDVPEQVSVTIKTVPVDDDEAAVQIARTLQKNMAAVGIDASIELLAASELLRDALVNWNFDIYVGQYPPYHDPDFLRAALHSTFATERGWQNPFGMADLGLDSELRRQRTTTGADRQRAVTDVAHSVAEMQPFMTVCFPQEITVVRTDRFENWGQGDFEKPMSYLTLDPASDAAEQPATLGIALTDDRITKNLNPIAVEYRRPNPLTDLLYDSLLRRRAGDVRPWLAEDVTWNRTAAATTATVDLRKGMSFHDGKPLTAADVVFTYRFLADTSLGTGDMNVPAPRFRGRSSLVESIERLDGRTVRFGFGETAADVATRALTVPILPAHVWKTKTGSADLAGIDIAEGVTQALVWANTDPVGSGPFRFESRTPAERLVLSRFEDHPLLGDGPGRLNVPFERLVVRIAPSDTAAASLVTDGTADATGDPLHPKGLENVTQQGAVERRIDDSRVFYHVGFNTRRNLFANVRFRRAVARLIDVENVVETVFDGYAAPAVTPLAGTSWEPRELRWDGSNPVVPFAGTDGNLNATTARNAFREAGYTYDSEKGRLLK